MDTRFKEWDRSNLKGSRIQISAINRLPESWTVKRIGGLAKNKKGAIKIGPFGSQLKKEEMVESGVSVFGQENVFNKDFKIGTYFINNEKYEKLKSVELFSGDIVLTMMGTIGDCCVVPSAIDKGIMDSHLMRIQVDESVNPYFISRLIRDSYIVKKQVECLSQGAIMSGLNLTLVKDIFLPIPNIEEQNEIEEILSIVDEVIEKTDAIILETKQLKKGLMQKLFVNKAFMILRKAKEEKTELKLIALHEFGEIVTGTTPSTTVREYYDNPEYMFIGPADIGQSKRIVKSVNRISKEGFAVSRQLPHNAVMVVGIGATIGKVGITSEPCATNQQINSIIPNTQEYPADYVYYLLVGISDYVSAFAGQTATPIMNKGEFGKMLTFMHPTLEQRQRVADILSAVDSKIESEHVYKSELEQLKKGLMQVLLTGKIRVKV